MIARIVDARHSQSQEQLQHQNIDRSKICSRKNYHSNRSVARRIRAICLLRLPRRMDVRLQASGRFEHDPLLLTNTVFISCIAQSPDSIHIAVPCIAFLFPIKIRLRHCYSASNVHSPSLNSQHPHQDVRHRFAQFRLHMTTSKHF